MDEIRELKLGDLMENEDQVVRALARQIERRIEEVERKPIGRMFSTIPKSRPPSSIPPRR